jgi:hypothetical protein
MKIALFVMIGMVVGAALFAFDTAMVSQEANTVPRHTRMVRYVQCGDFPHCIGRPAAAEAVMFSRRNVVMSQRCDVSVVYLSNRAGTDS